MTLTTAQAAWTPADRQDLGVHADPHPETQAWAYGLSALATPPERQAGASEGVL